MKKIFNIENVIQILIYGTLILWLFAFLLPIYPVMPEAGLDPSWRWTMNYAFLNNLHFGKDIYFTFGPLSDFWFPSYFYSESTYEIAIFISFSLALVIFISLYLVTYKLDNFSKILGLLTLIVGLQIGGNFMWYILPLLFTIVSLNDNYDKVLFRFMEITLVFFLSFSVLVKFSHFPTAVLSVLIIDIFYFYRYKIKIPLNTILLFIFMIILFLMSGQQLVDFLDYFIGSFNTLLGYSESMQSIGPTSMIWIFLSMSIIMAILFIQTIIKIKDVKGFVFFMISTLVLFMAFKNGFVRHDGHATAAFSGMSFVFGMLFLYYSPILKNDVIKFSFISIVVFISAISSLSVAGYYWGGKNFYQILIGNLDNSKNRIHEIPKLLSKQKIKANNDRYKSSLKNIKNQLDLGDIKGTVDIYPWDQSYIIANELNFKPRPLFQSYSVYTPYLIKRNKDFLYSNKSSENILFSIKNIDNRLPSMMEGSSWLDIMSLYDAYDTRGEFLLLKKAKVKKSYKLEKIVEKTISFNEKINIPKGLIFIELDIQKTFFGKIVNTLFKSPILNIELTFKNGSMEKRRIVPGIASSGFILSPYIDTIDKFFSFSLGEESGSVVQSIKVINDFGYCYKNEIVIKLKKIITNNFKVDKLSDNLKLLLFYNKILKQNKNNDTRFFNIESYKNKEIIFSHVGTSFVVNQKTINLIKKRNQLKMGIGIKENAYLGNGKSEGACFEIYANSILLKNRIFRKCIDPKNNLEDRGILEQKLNLNQLDTKYIFRVTPRDGRSSSWGWSYWKFDNGE